MKIVAALLLFIAAQAAMAITFKLAWSQTIQPNYMAARGQSIGFDINGGLYVQGPPGSGSLNWFVSVDNFGALRSTVLNPDIRAMAVEPQSATAFLASPGINSLEAIYGNGISALESIANGPTPLAIGFDSHRDEMVACANGNGHLLLVKAGPTCLTASAWSDLTFTVSAAEVTARSRVFAIGLSNGSSTQPEATLYDENGAVLWSRTFTDTSTETRSYDAFAEDASGNDYLVENINITKPISQSAILHCISPSNGQDLWSVNLGGHSLSVAAGDIHHVFVSVSELSTKIMELIDNGTVAKQVTFPACTLASAYDTSGTAIGAYFDGTSRVHLHKFATDLTQQYDLTYPAQSSADVGSFAFRPFRSEGAATGIQTDVYYAGSTELSSGNAIFLTKICEGLALSSMTLPASVIGGNDLNGSVTLTAAPVQNLLILVKSAGSTVASDFAFINSGSTSGSLTMHTVGVDAPSSIPVTATDSRGVVIPLSVQFLPASLSGASETTQSVKGGTLATCNVSFNGKTGPSGRNLTVISGNHSIIPVQGPYHIGPQVTQGQISFVVNPVAQNQVVTVGIVDGSVQKLYSLIVTP